MKAWDGKPGMSPYEKLNQDTASMYYASMLAPLAVLGGEIVSTGKMLAGGAIGGYANTIAQLSDKPIEEFSFLEAASATATGALGMGKSIPAVVAINVATDSAVKSIHGESLTPGEAAVSSGLGAIVGETLEKTLKFGKVLGTTIGTVVQETTNMLLKGNSK